jgi:hypothetical protein
MKIVICLDSAKTIGCTVVNIGTPNLYLSTGVMLDPVRVFRKELQERLWGLL